VLGEKYPIGTKFRYPPNGVIWLKYGIDQYKVRYSGKSVYHDGFTGNHDGYNWGSEWEITDPKEDNFTKLYKRLK